MEGAANCRHGCEQGLLYVLNKWTVLLYRKSLPEPGMQQGLNLNSLFPIALIVSVVGNEPGAIRNVEHTGTQIM